jgi:cell wall-active antibiotic response 4TMS protein YvqF
MSEDPVVTNSRSMRRSASAITTALILIGIGIVLLMSNLGVLPISIGELMRYWPVLLILLGISALIRRTS